MIKTVLMIVLMNIAQPSEPARMVHKAFSSPEACYAAADTMKKITPVGPDQRMFMFCASVSSLADETAI